MLFGLLSDRYERGSVLVTSNLDFASWTEIFGDPRLTAALLDRLTHRCHIVEFQVDSFRFGASPRRPEKAAPQTLISGALTHHNSPQAVGAFSSIGVTGIWIELTGVHDLIHSPPTSKTPAST